MKLEESNPTVQATMMLLKSVFYMSEILAPLPKEAYLTMKLVLDDEITPPDYQPPGFEPNENEKFFFPPNTVKLELGKVSTEINSYRMFLKTALSKEPLSQIYEESILTESQRSKNNEETEHENYSIPFQNRVSSKSDDFVSSKHEEEKVQCLCGCKEDSGTKILECGVCGKKQHSICYGILNHQVKSVFYCTQCINEVPHSFLQEDVLYSKNEHEQMELCTFRRALAFCTTLKQVTLFQLEKGLKCGKQLAKDMIAKLEKEDFIKKSGQKYIVNEKMIIRKGYWMYFRRTTENKENLEKSGKKKQSSENVSDDEDIEKERSSKNKRKSNVRANEDFLPEDEYMDLSIENEVKNLSLKGSQEKQIKKPLSRKRSSKLTLDDHEETFQAKPKKGKFLKGKEIVNLKQ